MKQVRLMKVATKLVKRSKPTPETAILPPVVFRPTKHQNTEKFWGNPSYYCHTAFESAQACVRGVACPSAGDTEKSTSLENQSFPTSTMRTRVFHTTREVCSEVCRKKREATSRGHSPRGCFLPKEAFGGYFGTLTIVQNPSIPIHR